MRLRAVLFRRDRRKKGNDIRGGESRDVRDHGLGSVFDRFDQLMLGLVINQWQGSSVYREGSGCCDHSQVVRRVLR